MCIYMHTHTYISIYEYIYIHTHTEKKREKDRKLLKLYLMKKENYPRGIREGCKRSSPGSNSRNSQHESLICEDVGNSC